MPHSRRPTRGHSRGSQKSAKSGLPWPKIGAIGAAVFILVMAVILVPVGFRAARRAMAINQTRSIVEKADETANYGDAAKSLEPHLAYLAEYLRVETDPDRLQAMSEILPLLSLEQLSDDCLSQPRVSVLFPGCVRLVARHDRQWLCEKSGHPNEALRVVCAEALAGLLPIGAAAETVITTLAQPVDAATKQKEFERLFDEQHQQIEKELVGEWPVQLAAEYLAGEKRRSTTFDLAEQVRVTCEKRVWTVKFFDQSWTGGFENMRSMTLKLDSKSVLTALSRFELNAELQRNELQAILSFSPPRSFAMQCSGFKEHAADGGWNFVELKNNRFKALNEEITLRSPNVPAGARFSFSELTETRQMANGVIEIKANGSDGQFSSAQWRLKGTPGFAKFEFSVLNPATPAAVGANRVRPLGTHSDRLFAVACSPTGESCASGGADERVLVWDLKTRQPMQTFGPLGAAVVELNWSRDGKRLAAGLTNGKVALLTCEGGAVKTLETSTSDPIGALHFHPQSDQVFCGSESGVIRQIDVAAGNITREFVGHSLPVTKMVVSSDGQSLVSLSHDETAIIWDIQSGQPRQTLTGHNGFPIAHDISPDGKFVVSIQTDGRVAVWDVASARTVVDFESGLSQVKSAQFVKSSRWLLVANMTGQICVLDLEKHNTVNSVKTEHTGVLWKACYISDKRDEVASVGFDRTLRLTVMPNMSQLEPVELKREEGALPRGLLRQWHATKAATRQVLVLNDGEFLGLPATNAILNPGAQQEVFRIWRQQDGRVVDRNDAQLFHPGALFACSADGRRLVSVERLFAGRDGIKVRTWEVDAQGKLLNPQPLSFEFRDVQLSSTARAQLDTSALSNLVANNERRFGVCGMAVSPTGKWAAIANGQGFVCLYNLKEGKLAYSFGIVIDREDGVLKEKYWSAISHQPLFLSDDEFVVSGHVVDVEKRNFYREMRMPDLLQSVSGGDDPMWDVALIPQQRRLLVAKGREVREVQIPTLTHPKPAAQQAPAPMPATQAAPGTPGSRTTPNRPGATLPQGRTKPSQAKPPQSPKSAPQPTPLFSYSHVTPVVALAVAQSGTQLLTIEESGACHLWNLAKGELVFSVALGPPTPTSARFLQNDVQLMTTHVDGTVRIWKVDDLRQQR